MYLNLRNLKLFFDWHTKFYLIVKIANWYQKSWEKIKTID